MKRFLLMLCALFCALTSFAELKYVFYFIGDGMGVNEVMAAEMYRSAIHGVPFGREQTLMTTFPYSGMTATYSKSSEVTDSSAAGTCLATGSKTNNGTLGLDANGDTLRTIAERLKADGWGVGIMTTVAIDHATPAAFYAHTDNRDNYYRIGQQLIASGFDFFGGAGFHHPQGKHDDEPVNLYRLAEQKGYTIAHGYQEAQQLLQQDAPESTKDPEAFVDRLILVQATDDQGAKHGHNLPYVIDRQPDDLTLAQITETAIAFMENNHERFFMMVEGGMIDYAGHGDDAATSIGEVWDMDEAMRVAYAFYQAHPDETLIVVAADHETGGMALGNSNYSLQLRLLQYQQCSSWVLSDLFAELFEDGRKPEWKEVRELYRTKLGFWDNVDISKEEEAMLKDTYKAAVANKSKDTKTLYKSINSLSDKGIALLNKKAKIGWTSHGHTASPTPVFSIGVGAELFTGWHDNTEMVPLLLQAISIERE